MAALVAGGVAIVRARSQARVEMTASMRLAELLVSDAANFVHQRLSAEQFLAALPAQLRSMRHVRIVVKNAAGDVAGPALSLGEQQHTPAPAWFAALVAPPIEWQDVPVIVNGQSLGEVEIIGEPADEITEVWENLVAMGSAGAVLNATMIAMLYVLFGRVLGPLTMLGTGLSDLERRSYSVRLRQPHARELAEIADRFNALARALEMTRQENEQLNRRLLTAQDDERRHTALELHDEVGPCLFGLKAYASSIAGVASELPEQAKQSMLECSREILAIIDHLQSINRSMLERLRPMALGHVPLREIIGQLVKERSRQHSQISFSFRTGELAASYGDSVDLTIYRCIQESLTNAIRHARAEHVTVTVRHDTAAAQLELTVRDDGCGISMPLPAGFGINGMQERVEVLGGHYAVESEAARGTCVRIVIPLAEPQTAAAEPDWMTGARV